MQIKNGKMTGVFDANGELSDEASRHIVNVIKTKAAILEYIEPIARVLAEAGRASAKAMGDPASYAINQWCDVIRQRAHEILRDEAAANRREATVVDRDPFGEGTVGHNGRNPLQDLIEGGGA